MQPYILGIDIGTGSTKSVAVNPKGVAFSVVKFSYPVYHPQQGFSEQDPELIWLAFIDSIRTQVQKLQQSPVAMCLSSVMHSVIAVDKNGIALDRMITWADARSEDTAIELSNSASAEDLYRRTGTPLHAMSPLCKIMWLRQNKEDLFSNTHKFISIKEYIWFKLFNEFKIDISIASATGLLNILTNHWDEGALQLAGITEEKLSTVVNTGYISKISNAYISNLLNIPVDVSFIIGASDGCFATLASHVQEKHAASVTIGTSGAVRKINKQPVYNFSEMTFNYKLDEETFVCGGAINNGGNILQWFLTNFVEEETITNADYEAFFLDVETVKPGANGLLFLPYLHGERAPHWDTKSCGSFFGIKQHHKRSHFARSVIEGICYTLNEVLLTLQKTGQPITQLHVSGGFTTSVLWMQILADITGKKVLLFNADDASATGAAYFGLKTTGLTEDYHNFSSGKHIVHLEPDLNNHQLYNSYFDIFKTLYPLLKNSMHNLYNLDH